MRFLSPLARKRLAAFRRLRRGWYSLWLLLAVFVFCLAADFVCPVPPAAVADPATLEKYQRPETVRTYAVRTARFNAASGGAVSAFEGPADVRDALADGWSAAAKARLAGEYAIEERPGAAGARVYLEPHSPPVATERQLPPRDVAFPFPPCPEHPFGLDSGGRDVYSLVVHALRIALLFALALSLSGLLLGLVLGAVEGYFGGWLDLGLQRFTEVWSALPFLYVMIFVGSTLGRGFWVLFVSYALFNWITVSAYVRSEFLRLRSRPFVDSARVQGLSTVRILFTQILPNALTPLITLFPFLFMGAIGSLSALDFLGFGLPPMTPSCGELLSQAQQFRSAWWLVAFPAAALFLVMLLAVFVGEGLRDAFDPRERTRLE